MTSSRWRSEALVSADGEKVMAQVAQAASRGVDWENLLVETLALLHRIAMQLLPSMLDNHYAAVEQRLRELALAAGRRATLLPDAAGGPQRAGLCAGSPHGVEMTLLRALAFHPKAVIRSRWRWCEPRRRRWRSRRPLHRNSRRSFRTRRRR